MSQKYKRTTVEKNVSSQSPGAEVEQMPFSIYYLFFVYLTQTEVRSISIEAKSSLWKVVNTLLERTKKKPA